MFAPPTEPARARERGQEGSPADWAVLRGRLTLVGVLAFLVYVALLAYGDWALLRSSLASFPWRWLPAILALVLVNYIGRWMKWLWYLRLIGSPIGRGDATRAFGIGFLMVLTPGKLGEFLKSYVVKRVSGTPVSVSAPIIVAERLTDGLALCVLAGVGLFGLPDPGLRRSAFVIFAGLAATVMVIWLRPVALALLRLWGRLPVAGRLASELHQAYESAHLLFRPANLAIAVAVGVVSWLGEGLAYYLIIRGVGGGAATDGLSGFGLAATTVAIFSASTLLGAVLATPGGLGTIEVSLVALGQAWLGLDRVQATTASLIVRFATLWFGVGLGLISLALWWRLVFGPEGAPPAGDLDAT